MPQGGKSGAGGASGPAKAAGGRGGTRPKIKRDTPAMFFEKIAQDGNTLAYSCVCLSVLAFIMLGFGLALVIVGIVKTLEDLILVGGLFFAGGLVFVSLLIINVCCPFCKSNSVGISDIDKELLLIKEDKKGIKNFSYVEEYDPDPYIAEEVDLPSIAERPKSSVSSAPVVGLRKEVSRTQLYSYDSVVHSPASAPTPATATDVYMGTKMWTEPETPPPPSRMVSPDDPALRSAAVYTPAPSAAKGPKKKDVSDLELL